ncbi:MAG: 1-acyl-sn-glycerol-3-phosphate acyltransferase [Planctomycetes bacterium]|nr:1-acyl-sn-glycerol-3-phosphate acyltransferase [Planctomycetota bacterium]
MAAARSRPPLLDPLWRFLRALRAAVTVLLYLVIAPSGLLPYVLFRLFFRGTPEQRARILQRTSARGVRVMHWWLRTFRVIHFDWREVRLALPEGPCVIVANHPTQLDPTVMMAVLGEACTIVKPSVYNRLFVHHILAGAWHFEGPSLDPMSVGHVVENAVQRLRCGMHLFVFPEAKRSPQGRLREFGRIAFEIACRANVPLVSVAIRCEPCYLSRETPMFLPPPRLPRVFVEVLAVDRPQDVDTDSRALKQRVEARYEQWVADGMPPVATPPTTGRQPISSGASGLPSRSSMRPPSGT